MLVKKNGLTYPKITKVEKCYLWNSRVLEERTKRTTNNHPHQQMKNRLSKALDRFERRGTDLMFS